MLPTFALLLLLALGVSLLASLPKHLHLHRTDDAHFLDKFASDARSKQTLAFPAGFSFGIATAPAHVEDQLDDAWLEFARKGRVAAWKNAVAPEQRIKFWSEPHEEIHLASELGVDTFRLGVDWARVYPQGPDGGADKGVLVKYRNILDEIKKSKMKVMLTLFHHSLPSWSAELGGWTNATTVGHFVEFASHVVDAMGDLVDVYTIFNEPHVYVLLTHCAGVWPPGEKPDMVEAALCLAPSAAQGAYTASLINMAEAHKRVHAIVKRKDANTMVGAAHHIGVLTPNGPADVVPAAWSHFMFTFYFPDLIASHVDFLGVNYYGQELLAGADVAVSTTEEYSEAGRGVYPDGLYHFLLAFHRRYGSKLPLWVTENGVADATDNLRPVYLMEHLLAIQAAIARGVKVLGYVFWTMSDNWEWADGYCPKFGLVEVRRSLKDDGTLALERAKRRSFGVYQKIIQSNAVDTRERQASWNELMRLAKENATRPFCRALEGVGGMTGAFGLDEPVHRPWIAKDWRLGAYRTHAAEHIGVEHLPLPWHTTPEWMISKDVAKGLAYIYESSVNVSSRVIRDEL
ncbi:galactolipid galactosyltransferase [Pycnococcus provasolii]